MTNCIYSFSSDGDFIGKTLELPDSTTENFLGVCYLTASPESDGYYAVNVYTGGSTPQNPQFSYLDKTGKLVSLIPGRELKDGVFMPDRMFTDFENGRVFAWDQLVDTLFLVNRDGVEPYYIFDFGENAFPAEYQQGNYYDREARFLEEHSGKPYASFLKYFQVVDGYMYFSFFTPRDPLVVYIVRYDERNSRSSIITLTDPNGKLALNVFFKVTPEYVIASLGNNGDTEANPSLYLLPLSTFDID